ncbi:hypothetical protein [Streptomyces sp. NPDC001020]
MAIAVWTSQATAHSTGGLQRRYSSWQPRGPAHPQRAGLRPHPDRLGAVYQIEGEPETVLRPGDVFYEPEGVRIARFDAQEEDVTFFGYFLLADGVNPELVFPEV